MEINCENFIEKGFFQITFEDSTTGNTDFANATVQIKDSENDSTLVKFKGKFLINFQRILNVSFLLGLSILCYDGLF